MSDTTQLTDDEQATLATVVRAVFPHDRFPDGPYERSAEAVAAAATASPYSALALAEGIRSLPEDFDEMEPENAEKVIAEIADTEFISLVRRTCVVALYDDAEVWELLGYEGPSFDQGGYVDRGFNDLDWLPDPRIEEHPDLTGASEETS